MNKKASILVLGIIILVVLMAALGVYILFLRNGDTNNNDKGTTNISIPNEDNDYTSVSEGMDCNILLRNGSIYSIELGKFSEPYVPNYQKPLSEIDYSKMTSMLDAYHSYGGYGWEDYLSVLDDNSKERAISGNEKSNGDVSKMFDTHQGDFSEPSNPVLYTHWLEFSRDGEIHRLIVGKNREGATPVAEFVRQNGGWRITTSYSMGLLPFSIDNYEVLATSCI